MLAVPPALLDVLHLRVGSTVEIAVDGGKLIIEPQQKPHYSLDELLAQCDPNAPVTNEERTWFDVEPVGHEL